MASAMQLYAAFALLVIAIVAIITIVALVSNLIGVLRRRFGQDWSIAFGHPRIAFGGSARFALTPRSQPGSATRHVGRAVHALPQPLSSHPRTRWAGLP